MTKVGKCQYWAEKNTFLLQNYIYNANCYFSSVVNSINYSLLVQACNQGTLLVLVPGLYLITCLACSFDAFSLLSFLCNLIWKIFGLRFIYCFSYEKFVSKFCHRELKSEVAELRHKFWTKVLDAKLRVKSHKLQHCDKLHIAVL